MAVHISTSTHAVMQVLYHVCQQIAASNPMRCTTPVEDIASLQQAQDLEVQDQHHILALQFRVGKKELLQSCLWQYDIISSSCNRQGPWELHTETVTVVLSRQAEDGVVVCTANCSHVHSTISAVVGYVVTPPAQSQVSKQARYPGSMSMG